jgi:hypothetical protein
MCLHIRSNFFYKLQLRDKADVSVENLQKCIQCGKTIRMPQFNSITVPSEHQDNPVYQWEQGTDIIPEEYICQVVIDSQIM